MADGITAVSAIDRPSNLELKRTSGSDGGSPAVAVSNEGQGGRAASPVPCPLQTHGGGSGCVPSLLVYTNITARKPNRRRKRCFHRVMSGLERGGRFRILMLSSGQTDKVAAQRAITCIKRKGTASGASGRLHSGS